jgi:diaminopimelate decarboxylase
VPIADLVAEHGSPLWLVNLEVVRDRWRTISALWRASWPDVQIAYAYPANRDPSILRALSGAEAAHLVTSKPDHDRALALTGDDGKRIVVGGAGLGRPLLDAAAAHGSLVIADSASQARAAGDAGVRRLGLRTMPAGTRMGASFLGVPAADVAAIARPPGATKARLEALAMHLPASAYSRPAREVTRALSSLVTTWPHPPERYATNARVLGSLAARLGVQAVDVGGGFPPAPDEAMYVRAVTGALGAVGFEGRLIVEPGRAVVGEAVELLCTVVAVKDPETGSPCVAVDAGHELVPGVLWRWPHIDIADGRGGATRPTMVVGPGTDSYDVLHPVANLPPLGEGDVLVLRRVGAYNQTRSTQHAAARAGVAVWDAGRWSAARSDLSGV